ncbi:MAG TPA: SLBB domain-containing protein [Fimbriimonadaceae bacterium]|nr:SLBB domain-containing protein [Fimbriimonadaceae bacterium]
MPAKKFIVSLFLALTALMAGAQNQAPPVGPDYVIGPEDTIEVTTRGVPEFSGTFLVRSDGKITMTTIGDILVSGYTVEKAAKVIAEQLSRELRSPEVFVSIKSPKAHRVYLMGSVGAPGMHEYRPGWRLTELIAAAGGLSGLPERLRAVIFRKGENSIKVEMKDLFVHAKPDANVEVRPGDFINIQGDPTMQVTIVGEVARNGMVTILEGQGAVEAIAAAGGYKETAALSKAMIRKANGEEVPVDLHGAILLALPEKNIKLEHGDTLTVPEHRGRVSVVGFVGSPGPMPIPDGRELTFIEAINLAGGMRPGAKTDGVTLARRNEQGQYVTTNYNYKDIFAGKKPDFTLRDGDVVFIAQSGKTNVSQAASVIGFIMTGGGLWRLPGIF